MNSILVTGATGHLGTAVLETLLKTIPSHQISILTRNEDKQKDFQSKGFISCLGSYNDVEALDKAMQNVDTILLISSGDQGDRMREHKNVIDTAKKTGVKRIAYTSRCLHDRASLANELMVEHFETEDYIMASGLAYTIFRNILYMDAIPQFIGGNIALERGIFLPAGTGRVAFALRSEMGEAMARVLAEAESGNKIYHLTSNKTYSFDDIASTLSELSGKEVKYTDISETAFAEMMTKRNIPQPAIQKIINFVTDIKHNQEADIYHDLEHILGRKPASLKNGLKQLFDL